MDKPNDKKSKPPKAERKILMSSILIVILCIGTYSLYIFAAHHNFITLFTSKARKFEVKNQILETKIEEIKLLKEKLIAKVNMAESKKNYFLDQNDSAKKLIRQVSEQENIDNLEQAKDNLVIRNEMKLIYRRNAYINKITTLVQTEKNGISELDFYYKKAIDELMLLKINKNGEIENLTAEINGIYNKYLPEASEMVLDIKNIENPPLDIIWSEITKAEGERIKR